MLTFSNLVCGALLLTVLLVRGVPAVISTLAARQHVLFEQTRVAFPGSQYLTFSTATERVLMRLGDVLELLTIVVLVWLVIVPSLRSTLRGTTWLEYLWKPAALSALGGLLFLASVARVAHQRQIVEGAAVCAAGLLLVASSRAAVLPTASWLLRVAVVAFVPRLIAALAFHLYAVPSNPRAVILDDESAYDHAARVLSGFGDGGSAFATLPLSLRHLDGPHLTALAGLYWVTEGSTLVARLVGVLLGVAVVVLSAALASELSGRRAGLVAGLLLALQPGLIVWSATVLKEALVAALVVLAVWAIRQWWVRSEWRLLVLMLLLLHVLSLVRLYAAVALGVVFAISVGVWLVYHARRSTRRLAAPLVFSSAVTVLMLVLVGFDLAGVAQHLRPSALLYQNVVMRMSPSPYGRLGALEDHAELVGGEVGGPIVVVTDAQSGRRTPGMILANSRTRGSNGDPEVVYVATVDGGLSAVSPAQIQFMDQVSDQEALPFLSTLLWGGAASALISPFDSAWTKWSYVLLLADTTTWLVLFACAIGTVFLARSWPPSLLFVYVVVIVGALSVGPGNPGNLVRQRAALTLPVLAALAAPMLLRLAALVRPRGRPPSLAARPLDT